MKNSDFPPLYLIDAYGLIYRSYFAFLTRPLRNNSGKNVSALFGFARSVISLLDDGAPTADSSGKLQDKLEKPLRLAAVFDSQAPTFRHEMYPKYKANRQKAPEDLHEQIPLVEEFLTSLGVQCIKADGFEADDIIATLAEKCRNENRQCYILSSDKDLLQLVGGGVYELRPSKINRSEAPASNPAWDLVGFDQVKTDWGVEPAKVLDLFSLIGDNSDNIPGVKGIGEKTAVKLMVRYGSLDEIYKNIAAIEGAAGKKLSEGKESAYFSKSLIRLRSDVDLPVNNIDDFSIEKLDRSAGAKVLIREGIRQSAKQLDPDVKPAAQNEHGSQSASGDSKHDSEMSPAHENVSFSSVDQVILGDGVYKTILDLEELKQVLAQAKKQKLLALDFETDSLDAWNSRPVGISFAVKPREAFYVPLVPHGDAAFPSPFIDPEKVRSLLVPFFADSTMTIVAHNAKFDYKVSRGWGVDRWQCKIWDPMVAAWLVDPERSSYSLDSLVAYTFDCNPTKYLDIVPKGSTFAAVPLETATRYAGEDSDFCLRLKHYFEPILKKNGASLFFFFIMPLLPILAEL
jgi:DNA polymerase-1